MRLQADFSMRLHLGRLQTSEWFYYTESETDLESFQQYDSILYIESTLDFV
jgi:hypothetical protein